MADSTLCLPNIGRCVFVVLRPAPQSGRITDHVNGEDRPR